MSISNSDDRSVKETMFEIFVTIIFLLLSPVWIAGFFVNNVTIVKFLLFPAVVTAFKKRRFDGVSLSFGFFFQSSPDFL